jgi:membrane protease YdiL (CAAX protease family)
MVIIIPLLIQISVLVVVTWLFHTKIGDYPEPLPLSDNPKKEIREGLILVSIVFGFLVIGAIVIVSFFTSQLLDPYPLELILFLTVLLSIPELVLGYLFVTRVNKWTINDLGLTTKIQTKKVMIYAIFITIIINIASLMFVTPTPIPFLFLLIVLYENIFLEEFFFRGIFQSKFERAIGQKKALLWTGIIFGLIHVINNYAMPLYLGGEIRDVIISGTLALILQIINGWYLGIIYMKTRNLLPGIIVHFLSNYLAAILIWFAI